MNRLAVVASAAALIITGCGGSPQTAATSQPTQRAEPSSASPTARASALGTTTQATLLLDQAGTGPSRTVWSLRVEDTAAKPLAEQMFNHSMIMFRRSLTAGDYRVIVWSRPCDGTCPATGESGVGPLKEVCGAQLTLAAGKQTKATAVLATDATCTIKIAH